MVMDATTVAAWVGAITGSVGTITGISALLWDYYKWKHSGPKLKIEVIPGMAAINVPHIAPTDRVIWVKVINTGSGRTTITNLAFFYFENEPDKDITKSVPTQQSVVMSPGMGNQQLPYFLESGGQWDGFAKQDVETERQARTGYYYAVVYHTMSDNPLFGRVVFKDEEARPV